MCGRYVLSQRPSVIRQRLEEQHMPADDAPPDDDDHVRQTYNFAPGYHGLIYRADTADSGAGEKNEDGEPSPKKVRLSNPRQAGGSKDETVKYKLQFAKWGLVPFWNKRPPDFASQMRTINCRDDSLMEDRGMWVTMKKRKRCIVVAEGFYEWLKKNDGREKIPHYTKRKDGQMMCFAGLWDMVKFEDSEEKLYSYTIITTDANKQLRFLHDRMPVILEPGSDAMKAWLDPNNNSWSTELQRMLKPYEGDLECYVVDKGVGKVGNNSPNFVIPVNSKENKSNIANFFDKQKEKGTKQEKEGVRETAQNAEDPESNAPLPKPQNESENEFDRAIKKDVAALPDRNLQMIEKERNDALIKQEMEELDDEAIEEAAKSPPVMRSPTTVRCAAQLETPAKTPSKSSHKTRSATSNKTTPRTPSKGGGDAKITSFFGSKT